MDSAQLTLDKELLLRNVCYKISLLSGHSSRSFTSIFDGSIVDDTDHFTQQQQQQQREPSSRGTDHMILSDGPINNVDKQLNMSSSKDDDDEIPIHDPIGVIVPEQLPPIDNKRSRLKRFANIDDDSRKYQVPGSSHTPIPNPLGEGNASSHGKSDLEVAQSILDKDELSTNHNSVPKGLVAAAAVPPPFDKDKLRMKGIRDHRRIVKGTNQPSIESIPSAAQQHGLLPSIEQPKNGHRRKQHSSALKQLSKDDSKTDLKSELRLPPLVPPRPRVPSTPPLVPKESMRDSDDNNQEQSLSAKKRRPKKPLFMRMIDEAQRRYEEDEKLKHEEYNKFKEHKAKRPTREEIKAHMALHDQQRELVKQRNEEMRKNAVPPLRPPKGLRKFNGNDASPDSISMDSDDSGIIIDTHVHHVMRPPRDGSMESLSALSSPRGSKNSKLHHPSKKGDRRVRLVDAPAVAAVVTTSVLSVSGREYPNPQLPSSLSNEEGGGGANPLEKSTMLPPAAIRPPSLASYISSDWLVQCLHGGDDWVTGTGDHHRWPQAPPPVDALKIM